MTKLKPSRLEFQEGFEELENVDLGEEEEEEPEKQECGEEEEKILRNKESGF